MEPTEDERRDVSDLCDVLGPLVGKLLTLARQSHHCCDDRWYSCPAHEDGCANDNETVCNCGADKHNANVEALRIQLVSALQGPNVRVNLETTR